MRRIKVKPSSWSGLLLSIAFLFFHQAVPLCAETLDERIDRIISRMTVEEKILQLHRDGSMNTADNDRLGIPGFSMADGPHGVREGLATCFPVGIAMAATWDTELACLIGAAMGREFRGKGKHQALGPCMDLCRDPRNGRSPESGGEDPYLCAQITTAVTRGIQSTHCIATIKHYNCKNRQLNRTENDHTVSMRYLMEHYGLNFRTAVQTGGALSVMNAYNLINGEKCAENFTLLTTILREKWGFPFYVVSDWGSIWNSEKAVKAGCDVCMGSANYEDDLPGLVARGAVSEAVIDEAVRRVLLTKIAAGMLDYTPDGDPADMNCEAHKRLCLEAGRRCIVLLKNQDNFLPLDKTKIRKIALIGPSADEARLDGSGSSTVTPYYSVSPRQGIAARIGSENVLYAKGCDINNNGTSGFADAVQKASSADVVVYVGGLNYTQEGEGLDRVGDSIDLPGKQQDLIIELARANPNLVVVLESGGICGINRSIGGIKGLLVAFYPGQEGGNAIADVLFGDVNPGGKLPVTMPMSDFQLPERNKNFNDDFGCGYRWFDEKGIPPQFAFGFGLSYTTFNYRNFVIMPPSVPAGRPIQVRVDVENTGQRTGDEVVQLYLAHGGSKIPMPKKQLKGFQRVALEPGEIKTVLFTITSDELYTYDEANGCYTVDSGTYTILAGGSSDNLPLSGHVDVTPSAAKSDLLICDIRTIPPQPCKGSPVLFLATVLNRGTGPSPAGVAHKVSFRVNGTEASWSNGFEKSIPAGGMALVCADGGPSGSNVWTAPEAGSYAVEAMVDPSNAVSECAEENNTASISVEVLPPPPKNLAAGAAVTVSSVEGAGFEGDKAVDGNFKTRWSSVRSDPQTITLDLGNVYGIDQVVLTWETAYGKEYLIQTSMDGLVWTDALHVEDGDGETDKLALSANARYVRMNGIKKGTYWGYSLYEFQVYSNQITSVPSETKPPWGFSLGYAYPNPFFARGGSNPFTFVPYTLPEWTEVALQVLDVRGKRVKEVFRGAKEAGQYKASWDGTDDSGNVLPSGVYFFQMTAGSARFVQKMMLIR